jgi:hypothetical protein
MKTDSKSYLLKEYGSWSVLIVAYLVGVGVSHAFTWMLLPLFAALALLINSKQAFMKWRRSKEDRTPLVIFLGHAAAAAAILFAVFRNDITMLLPLLIFPAAYLLSNKLAGEHFILTEILGFVLLSLAGVLAKYLLTGGLDVRLFLGLAFYFTAGIFKIKAMLMKKTMDRVLTIAHVLLSAYVYYRMFIPLLILLPLVENIVAAATLYKVRLQTTGWIEVTKSVLFLVLFVSYY